MKFLLVPDMINRILNVSILWTLIWLGWSFVTKDPWWPSEVMNWTTADRGFFLVQVGLLTIGAAAAPVSLFPAHKDR
jgi:hypothetical protein